MIRCTVESQCSWSDGFIQKVPHERTLKQKITQAQSNLCFNLKHQMQTIGKGIASCRKQLDVRRHDASSRVPSICTPHHVPTRRARVELAHLQQSQSRVGNSRKHSPAAQRQRQKEPWGND